MKLNWLYMYVCVYYIDIDLFLPTPVHNRDIKKRKIKIKDDNAKDIKEVQDE